MLITSARGIGRQITSLLFRSMLMGRQRRVRRVEARAPWKSDGDVSRWIERVEDRVLLAGSDSFSGRTNLGSVASVTDTGSNVGFTGEGGEPAQSGTINSAWWTWTAPANGTLVVDTIGSNFDTFLTLATGSTVNALTVITQDDDGGGGVASKITVTVTSGTAYHFAVDGFNSDSGSITLNLNFASLGTEDFGDAPSAAQSGLASSYPTLLADNGARHTPMAGFSLGSNADTEGNGQPSAAANFDDTTGTPDDEDGVTFNGTLTSGSAGSISVFVTNSAGVSNPYLDAWIDYNRDGDWADSGEQIFSAAVVAGTNTLNFVVPEGAPAGQTFSRFRLHSGLTALAVTGLFANGEVEDHAVNIASPGVWIPQGPGPTINAQVTIPPNSPVNGAIQTIAPHPTNADIVYVGTVNGGVWKTTNATTSNTWTPLTDALPSQSIGAIEFDLTDPTFNTLLAGAGRWSNYASIGDDSGHLYYTTNGGNSWTVLAPSLLNNQKISAVAARGNIWLVTSVGGGVYRSTNAGATWTNINGLNGLGTGGTQDMAADPSNSNRFYVSMQSSAGIYRTDDAGATWTNVTGIVTGVSGASRVRLAVNASVGAVYVAVGAGGAGAATKVWRSASPGGTWTQLDDVFVHNGGQQNPNTSLAADPVNANLVYVAGDRITSSPFTGLSFRGNAAAASGSQWTILVNAGATSTAPHADTRDMEFRADGSLLESDDGGLYRHTNPGGTGSWVAAAGNIAAVEAHNVAYNSRNNTLVIGTQDNGTHLQTSSGSTQWTFINGGDGGDVAVDNATLAGSNQSIVYLSSQNLGGFRRVVYDSNNNFVSSTNLATITGVNFTTPIELNTIDPLRLLIGGSSALFESVNQGTTNTNIGGPGQPGFLQNAMVYGGSLSGTPNPDLIYVGASSTVYKRTTSGGAITATTALPAGAGQVNDVAIDPNNYNTVFATDSNQVFMSSNGGTAWTDITGNLGSLSSLNEIRTAVYVTGSAPYLAVGTRSGVFVSLASSFGTWVRLGTALPDVLVFDLIYNATDDVLIAGTFGRGVWTQPNASTVFVGPTTDFGDGPDAAQSGFVSSYPVTLAENGARHTATGPSLGANRDWEADGTHSALADADDTTGAPDDEDGVTISGAIIASKLAAATGTVTVNLQNAGGVSNRLDAWIDFNRDGDWNDSGEQIFSNFSLGVANGAQVLNFAIPQDTGSNVEQGTSYARFRVSTAGGLGVAGAAADGEVEDYQITIASSAAFVVDTILDESDGNFASGDFSLREAIELANAHAGPDEIQFAPGLSGNTITLSVGQLLVTDDLTIAGLGAANLTVSGGNSFRVFDLQSNPDVLISGLTISGGLTTGVVQLGAAIRSTGNLELMDSVVTNNSTTGSQSGGAGIFQGASGTLRLTNSTVSNNTAPNFFSPGGGIYSQGNVIVTSSIIDGNSTGGQFGAGAGIFVAGNDLTITDSTVSSNHATGADSSGGGIVVANGNLNVIRSTISGNDAVANAGGIGFDSNGNAVTATIVNSTISGNTAAVGGGIANFRGTLSLQHSTVTANTAAADSGSGVASFSDGTNIGSTVILSSIVADNTNSSVDNMLSGTGSNTFTSLGFNLVGTGNASGAFNLGSDQTGVSAGLNALADNGGLTRTHALLAGSLALNAGETSVPETNDQRGAGFARIVGTRADIGAFELQATNPTVTLSVNAVSISEVNGVATFTATLSEVSGVDVTVNLGFTGTATGGGSDYNSSVTQVVIAAGSLSGTMIVAAVQDVVDEANETVTVEITGVTNGAESGNQQVTTTILDDDMAGLTVSIVPASLSEHGGTAIGTVTRNNSDNSQALTVSLITNDATELDVPATVTIPAGASFAIFTVTGVDDSIFDGTQTITVTASESFGGATFDTTFGTGGFAALPDYWLSVDPAFPEIVTQPDGKIVVAARHPTIETSWNIIRLNPDGALDATFGIGGIVTSTFPAAASGVLPQGIALYPNGDIIVVGQEFGGSNHFVARYTSLGTENLHVDSTSTLSGEDIVVDNSGSGGFIVGGSLGGDMAAVRFLDDGTVDTSYGSAGIARLLLPATIDRGRKIVQQPDSKLLLVGDVTIAGLALSGDFGIARFNANGSVDTSFSSDGFQSVDFGGSDTGHNVALAPDGRIVMTGSANSRADWAITRLLPDGALDLSFSTDGKDVIDFSGLAQEEARAVAILDDGKIVVGGGAFVPPDGTNLALAQYNSDGSLDTSFDGDGKMILPPQPSVFEQVRSLAFQGNGSLIALGGFDMDFSVFRINFAAKSFLPGSTTVQVTDDEVQSLVVSSSSVLVTEGSTNTFTISLAVQPGGNVTVNIAHGSGDSDLSVTGNATLTFTSGNWNIPQTVTLTAVEDEDGTSDSAVFSVTTSGAPPVDVTATEVDNDVTYSLTTGVLTVTGTPLDDTITVLSDGGIIMIDAGGTVINTGLTTASVNSVIVSGLGGNDTLRLDNSLGSTRPGTLQGADGDDTLIGGLSNDKLEGGAGDDSLDGGAGNDTYFFDTDIQLNADSITDTAGNDRLSFVNSSNVVTVSLALTTAQPVNVNLTLTLGSAASIENITGGSGNDTLIGNTLDNILTGGGGADSLNGGFGDDNLIIDDLDTIVVGDVGYDRVTVSSATTTAGVVLNLTTGQIEYVSATASTFNNVFDATGAAWAVSIYGGSGNDTLTGGEGNDTLIGNSGDDVIVGNGGLDTLNGGLGSDSLNGGAFDDSLTIDNMDTTVIGGTGYDRVTVVNAAGVVTLDLFAGQIEYVSATTSTFNNVFVATGAPWAVTIYGGSGNDALTGGDGNDTLGGNSGDDVIVGRGGLDRLIGGLGADSLNGGADDDSLTIDHLDTTVIGGTGYDRVNVVGANGVVTLNLFAGQIEYVSAATSTFNNVLDATGATWAVSIYGGSGNDTITGGEGNDTLNGNAGDDLIVGNGGLDSLIGGLGTDSLSGGAEDDSLAIDHLDTTVVGGIGYDRVTVSGAMAAINLNLLASQIEYVSAATSTFNNVFDATGATWAVSIYGGSGNDTLTGGDGNDTLNGNAGDDVIVANGGLDRLIGGPGADSLNGGSEDDILTIDNDDISVVGGLGYDRVSVSGATAAVTLDLFDGQIEYLSATTSTFNNVFDATGATWDVTILGGTGNDTLIGGDGNDTLNGRAGNDLIIGNGGNDKLFGDIGIDTISYVTAGSSVNVNLVTKSATGGAGHDMLNSIENVTGSNFDDLITGDPNDNTLDGLDGLDIIFGGGGIDIILNA